MYEGLYIGEYSYDAWGNCEVSAIWSTDSIDRYILQNNPFRFKGYYYDIETQLYYCQTRYYNPRLYQWLSVDSLECLDIERFEGLKLYCYGNCNPINVQYTIVESFNKIVTTKTYKIVSDELRYNVNNSYSVPKWVNYVSTALDHSFTVVNPIRSSIACLKNFDIWDLMRLDGVTEFPGTLEKVATGVGWGLVIFGGVIAGYEKYRNGASIGTSVAGGLIRAGISIGGMFLSKAVASVVTSALIASSLAMPRGVIMLA